MLEQAESYITSTRDRYEFVTNPLLELYKHIEGRTKDVFENLNRFDRHFILETTSFNLEAEEILFTMNKELRLLKAVLDTYEKDKKQRIRQIKKDYQGGKLPKTDWTADRYEDETNLDEINEMSVRYEYLKSALDSLDRLSQTVKSTRISYSVISKNGVPDAGI